jgi:hypothetical protein
MMPSMTAPSPRLVAALADIDARNAQDPRQVATPHGDRPKELWAAERVTSWLRRLASQASAGAQPGELLQLAGRAHHLERWEIPRVSFPDGRTGYLQWRRALHDLHAERVAPILAAHGYPPDEIARVQDLLRKKGLGRVEDPELQMLEDALCLAFLDGGELAELIAKLEDPAKVVQVIRKTLAKMSPGGRTLALTVPLSARESVLVGRALDAGPDAGPPGDGGGEGEAGG